MGLIFRLSLSRNECHKNILTAGNDSVVHQKKYDATSSCQKMTHEKASLFFPLCLQTKQSRCLINILQPKFVTSAKMRNTNICTVSTCCSLEFLLLFVVMHQLTADLCRLFPWFVSASSQKPCKTFKCMVICQKFYSNKSESTQSEIKPASSSLETEMEFHLAEDTTT